MATTRLWQLASSSPISAARSSKPKVLLPRAFDQVRFFAARLNSSTPVPRIRIKKDPPLDAVADKEKSLAPVLRIRDVFLQFNKDSIPFRFLSIRRRNIGLRTTEERFEDFVRDYPTMFEIFLHPEEELPWIRLTPDAISLIEEEKMIHENQERENVVKLRKLLMMSKNQKMKANRIALASSFFGFPTDFVPRIVPKYPELFELSQNGKPYQTLELVIWDENLAETEFERKARANAIQAGFRDFETRGYPLRFETRYSPGVVPKQKAFAYLEKWQRLPYLCPYMDTEGISDHTPLADRRMVALLHEVLSLTLEKKITIEVLNHFRQEFNLPINLYKAVNKYPGIFYVSVKGAVHTLYLREAYERQKLLQEPHPLLTLKNKYYKLVSNGPKLRSMAAYAIRNAKCRV